MGNVTKMKGDVRADEEFLAIYSRGGKLVTDNSNEMSVGMK